jgi:hypothetical protein
MTNRARVVCLLFFTLAAGLVAGCNTKFPPVRLEGSTADLAQLVGKWSGEYISDYRWEPGGTIYFRLDAESEVAYGDVLMERRGTRRAFTPFGPPRPRRFNFTVPPQRLAISFVRAEDDTVVGELDQYWDFDRDCAALTVFRGVIDRDVVRGTYDTRYLGPFARDRGRWQVRREPAVH